MELTIEELAEVEEFAGLFYDLRSVAIILDKDIAGFRSEYLKEGALYRAYQRGVLKTESEVRRSIINLAKAGSSPAQNLAKGYIDDLKLQDL
jgi:hypothetical protein